MARIVVQTGVIGLVFAAALLLLAPHASAASDAELRIGVFPRRNATETVRIFSPLAHYLSERLGRKVILETSRDFHSFWISLQSGRFHVVHYNQYHYVRSHKELGYDVVAKIEERGESTIAGCLAVRKDRGLRTVADLRGRKIVFGGGRKAMQSYIIATHLLRSGGDPCLRRGFTTWARRTASKIALHPLHAL